MDRERQKGNSANKIQDKHTVKRDIKTEELTPTDRFK